MNGLLIMITIMMNVIVIAMKTVCPMKHLAVRKMEFHARRQSLLHIIDKRDEKKIMTKNCHGLFEFIQITLNKKIWV